jgi:hypothetical protein
MANILINSKGKCYCIGVAYVKDGQTDEEQIFQNGILHIFCSLDLEMSPAFETFMGLLGDKVEIKGWSGFRGGFDTS